MHMVLISSQVKPTKKVCSKKTTKKIWIFFFMARLLCKTAPYSPASALNMYQASLVKQADMPACDTMLSAKKL